MFVFLQTLYICTIVQQCATWSEGSMGNLRLTLRYEQGEKLSATVWGWGAQSAEIQGMLKQF